MLDNFGMFNVLFCLCVIHFFKVDNGQALIYYGNELRQKYLQFTFISAY